jgi:peroxiredoxin Q/BCP
MTPFFRQIELTKQGSQSPMTILQTGDTAPEFSLPTNGSSTLSLSDLAGKIVVLYFYPKDMTPGCTTESQEFRDKIKDFEKAGAVIIGASKDSVARHDKFVEKNGLPFSLISDETGTLCEDFGVWQLKKLYGREFMGIVRSTFIIGGDGIIRHVWPKVRVKGHVDEVLSTVQAL